MMILSSEAEILVEAGPVVRTNEEDKEIDPAITALSEEEAAAVFEGQAKIDAINTLLQSGITAIADPDGALIAANAIKAVIGDQTPNDDSLPTIGIEVATNAFNATEVIITPLEAYPHKFSGYNCFTP